MKVTGTIVAKTDGKLTLAVNSPAGCANCQANKQCITGVLATQSSTQARIDVQQQDNWQVGQPIELAITPYSLLKGASWVYLFPLLWLFVFAGISQYYLAIDGLTALMGLIGLLLGSLLARCYLKRHNWQQHLTLHASTNKTTIVDG